MDFESCNLDQRSAHALKHCSIGILCQGELNPEICNLKQRVAFIRILILGT